MNKLYFIFTFLLTAGILSNFGAAQNIRAPERKNTGVPKESYRSDYRRPMDKYVIEKDNPRSIRESLKKYVIKRDNAHNIRESFHSNYTFQQKRSVIERKDTHSFKEAYHRTLDGIGNGISSGRISSFSYLFSPQIYLNLSNGVSAYYSSNQAYYVMQEFLNTHQAISLNINDIQEDEENVYATGTYSFLVKGKRESSQIYLSLKHGSKKWQITQITIN